MDGQDSLVRLDEQLGELQAIAELLNDLPTVLRTARLRLLLAEMAGQQEQEQEPAGVPDQPAGRPLLREAHG